MAGTAPPPPPPSITGRSAPRYAADSAPARGWLAKYNDKHKVARGGWLAKYHDKHKVARERPERDGALLRSGNTLS